MKKEEIEHLLLAYANGEITGTDKEALKTLFETNPQLKTEAEEMAAIFRSLENMEESTTTSAAMDSDFYSMLQTEKQGQQKTGNTIAFKVSWLRTTAAVVACIIAFAAGRYTTSPVEVLKYKTIVVKQPVPYQPKKTKADEMVAARPAHLLKTNTNKKPDDDPSELAQQLRSIYVSERIEAIMKLSVKTDISSEDLKIMQLALSEDPNPNVRLTILNALRPLAAKKNVQEVLIAAIDQQSDVMVQSTLIDMLVDTHSRQAIPQMIALLDDKNTNVMIQNKIKGGIESFLN